MPTDEAQQAAAASQAPETPKNKPTRRKAFPDHFEREDNTIEPVMSKNTNGPIHAAIR